MNADQWNAQARAYNEEAAKELSNLPDHFDYLEIPQQNALCKWIDENFSTIKTINRKVTTYRLKHIFEEGNFYISNGQMKGALLTCGFKAVPVGDFGVNWFVNVSTLSIRQATEKNHDARRLKW